MKLVGLDCYTWLNIKTRLSTILSQKELGPYELKDSSTKKDYTRLIRSILTIAYLNTPLRLKLDIYM